METQPGRYEFAGGYPTPETVRRAYDEADLNRAVQAYRFFYPSVSIMATWKGNLRAGMVANTVFGLLEGTPKQFVFTPGLVHGRGRKNPRTGAVGAVTPTARPASCL